MNDRWQPPPYAIQCAIDAANTSGCSKSHRGVSLFGVIYGSDQVVATGTNRPADGACDGSNACRRDCAKICIHAEQAALLSPALDSVRPEHAEMVHIKTVDGRHVPSGPPKCVDCSKLILQAGIAGIWLLHDEGWCYYPAVEFHRRSLQTCILHHNPVQTPA